MWTRRKYTFGNIGAILDNKSPVDCSCKLECGAFGVNDFLSLRNRRRPAPPEPSVCVIPMYNFYKKKNRKQSTMKNLLFKNSSIIENKIQACHVLFYFTKNEEQKKGNN